MRLLIYGVGHSDLGPISNFLRAAAFAVDVAKELEQDRLGLGLTDCDLIILNATAENLEGTLAWLSGVRSRNHSQPILAIGHNLLVGSATALLNAGADDFLESPFDFQELLARVRALLRRPRQVISEILKIDNLILDGRTRSVLRGAKQIRLTLKEFSLLEFLMRHRGAPLSRRLLSEHVWDGDFDPFSNTIEAHILNLRKKIESKNGRKLIQTVPGIGYKID